MSLQITGKLLVEMNKLISDFNEDAQALLNHLEARYGGWNNFPEMKLACHYNELKVLDTTTLSLNLQDNVIGVEFANVDDPYSGEQFTAKFYISIDTEGNLKYDI